jgi:hypothetical protein
VAGPEPAGRQRWRTILAVLLIVVGCVLAPLAGVAPLASDPAIQAAVADQITAQVFAYLDVQSLTKPCGAAFGSSRRAPA